LSRASQEPLHSDNARKRIVSAKNGGTLVSGKISLTDLEHVSLVWRKAQFSSNNGACIEVASAGGKIALRDSKDPSGAVLVYTPAEWHAFLDGAKKGEFDDLAC